MGLQTYLGNDLINLNNTFLGTINVQYEQQNIEGFPVTNGLDVWFDAQSWSGTGNLNSKQGGNYTASLYNVVKDSAKGGIMTFQSSSVLQVSGSANSAIDYSAFASYSVVLIAKNSGSSALFHGRILNGITNNWLFGTYEAGSTGYSEAWYNGNFVYNSAGGSEDNAWRIYTGVQHSTLSSSMYVNNTYRGGLSNNSAYGFNGLAVNKGAFITAGNPASGEYTYVEIGQILIYNRPLTQTEIGQIYTYFSGSYF
jgi:hypothetical protein